MLHTIWSTAKRQWADYPSAVWQMSGMCRKTSIGMVLSVNAGRKAVMRCPFSHADIRHITCPYFQYWVHDFEKAGYTAVYETAKKVPSKDGKVKVLRGRRIWRKDKTPPLSRYTIQRFVETHTTSLESWQCSLW